MLTEEASNVVESNIFLSLTAPAINGPGSYRRSGKQYGDVENGITAIYISNHITTAVHKSFAFFNDASSYCQYCSTITEAKIVESNRILKKKL